MAVSACPARRSSVVLDASTLEPSVTLAGRSPAGAPALGARGGLSQPRTACDTHFAFRCAFTTWRRFGAEDAEAAPPSVISTPAIPTTRINRRIVPLPRLDASPAARAASGRRPARYAWRPVGRPLSGLSSFPRGERARGRPTVARLTTARRSSLVVGVTCARRRLRSGGDGARAGVGDERLPGGAAAGDRAGDGHLQARGGGEDPARSAWMPGGRVTRTGPGQELLATCGFPIAPSRRSRGFYVILCPGRGLVHGSTEIERIRRKVIGELADLPLAPWRPRRLTRRERAVRTLSRAWRRAGGPPR